MTLSTVLRPRANLAKHTLTEDRAADLVLKFESLGLTDEADEIIKAFDL